MVVLHRAVNRLTCLLAQKNLENKGFLQCWQALAVVENRFKAGRPPFTGTLYTV